MQWVPRAITLDLDDTLWPIAPAIERAEAALDEWLRGHAPRAATRWPVAARRKLRDEVEAAHPELAHDFTRQRLITLERMLHDSGEDVTLVPSAFEAYFAARCEVDHYDDTLAALDRLAAQVPLAAISNGNACLVRIGLMDRFRFQLAAREHGVAKPAASIFHAACSRLGMPPQDVLHVGDDPGHDVAGAARAGLRTCWINRRGETWAHADALPDLVFEHLGTLADWLDARQYEGLPQRFRSTA
ncbi:MAG TPA: HAD family hydrolase [Xanthomonadaceae bacterium]|jgi:HAD superfamily hydrolase (TIGR01549 family)|nr:HAD family hydrolase [Xanthomonadaceae bacterium]